MPGIAVFSDELRDGLCGPVWEKDKGAFLSRPTFSIDTNSRIDFVDSLSNLVHCFNIMHPHQVKAEAVNMIFFYPIKKSL